MTAQGLRVRRWTWGAAGVATITYFAIIVALYAIAMSNAGLR